MSSLIKKALDTLSHDIDPEFLATVGKTLAWEYPLLYERIANDHGIPLEIKPEAYAKQRPGCAVKALVQACKQHGVPYDFRKLSCNGQYKLLVKMGRVVIIQEPMLTNDEHPRVSEYKREMVAATGFTQQLELDLGDMKRNVRDWTGSVVAALLHAPAGPRFTIEDRSLGAFMLGVPNETYNSWLMRLDLHRVALFGFNSTTDQLSPEHNESEPAAQKDNVTVKLRRHIKRSGREAS